MGYGLLAKAPFVPGEGTGKEGLVTLEGWWQGLCKLCFLVEFSKLSQPVTQNCVSKRHTAQLGDSSDQASQ